MTETCLNYVKGDDYCIWYSNNIVDIRKIKAAIEKYPNDVKVNSDYSDKEDDGGIEVQVPKSWFRTPMIPRKGRTFTEEEKRENAERLAKWRKNKDKNN